MELVAHSLTSGTEAAGWRRYLQAAVPPTLFVVLILVVWGALSAQGVIPRYLLPSPAAIAQEIYTNHAVLWKHAVYTTGEALSGFIIGNCAAVAAAVVFTYSPVTRACLYPWALATRAVPIAAITPIFVILLGFGVTPIVVIVALTAYFPTLLNVTRGLDSADTDYRELLHTLSAKPLQRLRIVDLPASMPYLFAALKVGASTAFISAITGEWIAAHAGLGYLIVISGQYFKIPTLWAAVFVAAALTLTLIGIVTLIEILLLHPSLRANRDPQ